MSNDEFQHKNTFCENVKSKKKLPIHIELIAVLENVKMKEDIGIEQLYKVRQTINMLEVDGFRESVSEDGEIEPFVIVYMRDGSRCCFDKTYNDFKILFNTYNNDNTII